MLAAVRVVLGVLGVASLIAGGVCMRLVQHDLHVAQAADAAREAHDRVGRVREAGRRLYAALDEPDTVFRLLATTNVKLVQDQVALMHTAAEGMSVARRDFVSAAGAYRDATRSDLGDHEKRVAHAEDTFIEAFVETQRMVVAVAANPKAQEAFRDAGDQLRSALVNGMAEYRSARDGIVRDMRTSLAATRSRADDADREAARLRAQTTTTNLLHP